MLKHSVCSLLFLVLVLTGCSTSRPVATPPAPPVENTSDEAPPEVESIDLSVAPDDWFHLDVDTEHFPGISSTRSYASLLNGKTPRQQVIVAVIDSGIDIEHDDLDDNIWTNEDEVPDNGEDDDQNGYVDDIHGWSFIGGPDGRNVEFDTFEATREYARLRGRYEEVDPATLSPAQREEYDYFQEVKASHEEKVASSEQIYSNIMGAYQALVQADQILTAHFRTPDYTLEQVEALSSSQEDLQRAKGLVLYLAEFGLHEVDALKEQVDQIEGRLKYGLNPDFDPRPLVGDNYADKSERFYGSPDVVGPDPFHGTHVAGIIAAERNNGLGIDGIAENVEIMVLRAVPNGDERDKDVANAIRYAVDNGAKIINMSFGKDFSPEKSLVDLAVRYAEERDVLLVHGAGNDALDLDTKAVYPNRNYASGGQASNWIEVGASSWEGLENLAASFSNYGKRSVDIFAPGVKIYSTVPGQAFKHSDGTSMASPVVAGVAALLRAYYPELTAPQVRDILLESAVPYAGTKVQRPGSDSFIDFAQLSQTGGIVNAYGALKLAEERVN